QQDSFGAAYARLAPRNSAGEHTLGDSGEVNSEDRSRSWLAIHLDKAAALLDDSIHGRQAQPGPLAHFLGGEEGFENMRLDRLLDAASGIAHGEHDVSAGRTIQLEAGALFVDFEVSGLERQPADARHGVPGVDYQVQAHLLELSRDTPDQS